MLERLENLEKLLSVNSKICHLTCFILTNVKQINYCVKIVFKCSLFICSFSFSFSVIFMHITRNENSEKNCWKVIVAEIKSKGEVEEFKVFIFSEGGCTGERTTISQIMFCSPLPGEPSYSQCYLLFQFHSGHPHTLNEILDHMQPTWLETGNTQVHWQNALCLWSSPYM